MFDLHDKIAIVTGASQGIGKTIALELSKNGAFVYCISRNKKAIESVVNNIINNGGESSSYSCDISDSDNFKEIIEKIVKKHNKIDILVNNAGIAGPSFKTWEYPLEEWKNVMDIDLSGVFYCSKAIVPHMIKANYGRIVNISSIAGKEGNPNASAYSTSKAGVIGLTKSLGKELAQKNIAVNCVTPAAAKTRIFDQMTEEHINYMLSKIPRNKFAKVEELASLVTWLASEENSFSTAAVFDLSGGRATY